MSQRSKRELPDIDDGPEVYETPDNETNREPENQVFEKLESSEDVLRAPIDASKSFEKFQNSQNMPFRNPFSTDIPEGYQEIPIETPQQKLRRLQFEIQELAKEVESTQGTQSQPADSVEILENVRKLESNLKKIEGSASYRSMNESAIENLTKHVGALPKIGSSKKEATTDSVTYDIYYRPDSSSISLPDAERRIAQIEEALGIQYIHDNPKTAHGLIKSINSLEQKVNSINPLQIEFISKKIKSIMSDMDKVIDIKSSSPSVETESQVTKILATLEKWDQTSDSLPTIIARLRDLKKIHESAATIVDSVDQISTEQKRISESLVTTQTTLETLDKNLSQNMKTIDRKSVV